MLYISFNSSPHWGKHVFPGFCWAPHFTQSSISAVSYLSYFSKSPIYLPLHCLDGLMIRYLSTLLHSRKALKVLDHFLLFVCCPLPEYFHTPSKNNNPKNMKTSKKFSYQL
jgi:hypothetical protein